MAALALAATAVAAAAVATLAATPAAIATRAADAAAPAAIAAGATNAAAIATATVLLHDRERLLRWGAHLDRERVRGRRHGAWPVRQDRDRQHMEHKLIHSARMLHLVLQHWWLVLPLWKLRVHLSDMWQPLRLW